MGVLSNFEKYLSNGVYIRYWVHYPSTYEFPGDRGDFENLKMFKIAGSTEGDVEFIYKDTGSGGPGTLQLYWFTESTKKLTSTYQSLQQTMSKGKWHKIEIYIKVASQSVIEVQVNDKKVYKNTNADILLPASMYTGTRQFISVKATNAGTPSSGKGYWNVDNVTIIHNQGNLCDNEPKEPSGSSGTTTPTVTVPPAPSGLAIK
jgi:hypothetical protein